MNARVDLSINEGASAPAPELVRQAVRGLLASPTFAKAPRMCDLLWYLVERKLAGEEAAITEHAIGLAVFRRAACDYDTALDPVVRVQIGRLRNRLVAHYATAAPAHALRISLPAGSYIPVISLAGASAPVARGRQLELMPLRNLTVEHRGSAFVSGVEEELGIRLFQAFDSAIQLRAPTLSGSAHPLDRLEGSIRIEKDHVRASMRVVDAAAGRITWVSQFDCSGELGMRLQEELASAICAKLQGYLAGN
jgi:hypothetical protein